MYSYVAIIFHRILFFQSIIFNQRETGHFSTLSPNIMCIISKQNIKHEANVIYTDCYHENNVMAKYQWQCFIECLLCARIFILFYKH